MHIDSFQQYPTTATTGESNADVNEAYTLHSMDSVKQTAPVEPVASLSPPGSSLRPTRVKGTPTNKISTSTENGVPEETMTQVNFQVNHYSFVEFHSLNILFHPKSLKRLVASRSTGWKATRQLAMTRMCSQMIQNCFSTS